MIDIRVYVDTNGNSPFARWFDGLNAPAALKVTAYMARLENGNTSSVKGLGGGVHECRIDWGPGYRVYFGRDGETLIILLGGGTKKRQPVDIDRAKIQWQHYKKEKKEK